MLFLLFLLCLYPLFFFVFIRDVVESLRPVFVKLLNLLHQGIHHVQIPFGHFVPRPTEQFKLICNGTRNTLSVIFEIRQTSRLSWLEIQNFIAFFVIYVAKLLNSPFHITCKMELFTTWIDIHMVFCAFIRIGGDRVGLWMQGSGLG